MGCTLVAILLATGAIVFYKSMDNKKILVQMILSVFIMLFAVSAVFALIIGVFGLCNTDNEFVLINTHEIEEPVINSSAIVFFDEDETTYVLIDDRVIVVTDKYNNESYACTIIKGEYEKAIIEEYHVEYHMNFWSFAVGDGKVFKLYLPE